MRRARVLAVLGILALAAERASAQGVVARVGGELTAFPDSTIAIPIVVDMSGAGGAKLGTYTARLQWDPAVLGFSTARPGDFNVPAVISDSSNLGVLRFSASSVPGSSGVVTLGRMAFYVSSTGGSSPVDLTFEEMSAAGTRASLQPVPPASGNFCTARGRWGDLDSDGFSNSRDALAVLSDIVGMTVGQAFDLTLGDVDGDTKTNSRDALIMLSFAVGLDITGQRVLLPAPAGCATGSPRQVSVFPATVELVPGQDFTFSVQGTDGSGHPVAVPTATWRSSDPTIAGVNGDGVVDPRTPGTVTVTATVAPGLQAQATITVIARRPNWYVDVGATGAAVQLGTIDRPYEAIALLQNLVLEGDTVRVASGTYPVSFNARFALGIVILGGTPGDTTTRPVFSSNGSTGLIFQGGLRSVVRNVAFVGFYQAVVLDGVRTFALEDARIDGTTFDASYSYGVYATCSAPVDTVRIDRSFFVSDSTGTGVTYEGCDPVGLTVVRNSKFSGWENGLQLFNIDSAAITNTVITGNTGTGLYIGGGENQAEALYMAHSRVERNEVAIEVDNAHRVVIDSSVVRSVSDETLAIFGSCCSATGKLYLHGDSIYHEANSEWIAAVNLDSLVFDHTIVRFPADTSTSVFSTISAQHGVLSYSKFLNVGFFQNPSQPFLFSGQSLFVDSLEMTGCNVAACAGGYGIWMNTEGPGNLTIQRSRFSKIANPILSTGSGPGTIQSVTDVVIDSAFVGIQVGGDSNHVSRNTLTRVVSGIHASSFGPYSRGQSVISGNNISCSAGGSGITFGGGQKTYLVFADTISSCDTGIFLNGLGSGTTISGSAIRGGQYGIEVAQDTSSIVIDSTGISGSSLAGIFLSSGRVTATRNRIENNAQYGVQVATSGFGVPQLHQNSFTGNVVSAVFAADTVDASFNWWGAATGACTTGADCVSGRVNVDNPLGSPPSPLPGLVAPIFASAGMMRTAAVAVSPVVAVPAASSGVRAASSADPRAAAARARLLQRHRALDAERRRHRAEVRAHNERERQRVVVKPVAGKIAPR